TSRRSSRGFRALRAVFEVAFSFWPSFSFKNRSASLPRPPSNSHFVSLNQTADCRPIQCTRTLMCGRLPGLSPYILIHVADSFPFVGLRRPKASNLRGHLTDHLLIGAFYDNDGVLSALGIHFYRHTLRWDEVDGV